MVLPNFCNGTKSTILAFSVLIFNQPISDNKFNIKSHRSPISKSIFHIVIFKVFDLNSRNRLTSKAGLWFVLQLSSKSKLAPFSGNLPLPTSEVPKSYFILEVSSHCDGESFSPPPAMSYFQDLEEKASCTRVGPFGEPYNVMIMGQFTEILPSATKCMGSHV